LFGAFLMHGITPGPLLIKEHPDVFWCIIGSMYIGNIALLVMNLPLIPLWVQVLRIPDRFLYPAIILLCMIGSFSINNNVFDVFIMIIFGVIGYLLRKFDYEPAPLLLAFVLGPMFEVNLRRSLLLSQGSFGIFLERPLALGALFLCGLMIALSVYQAAEKIKNPRG